MSHVRVRGLSKSFGAIEAVRELNLEIERGELMAVLGPSGCGKTTLLRVIAGFEQPDAGCVVVSDEVVAGPGRIVPPEKRRVGMVFQDYALFPHLSVEGNVAFGLTNRPREERDALTRRTLELVGLQHKARCDVHELSGGERQRVALARALAPEPELVLLDEPFSSLDATLRGGLRREVELILRDAEATALLVTHDQEEALSLADRVAVMRDGEIVQVGPPVEVYGEPATRWAAQFVGEVNVLSGVARGGGVETELGVFDLRAPASGLRARGRSSRAARAARGRQRERRGGRTRVPRPRRALPAAPRGRQDAAGAAALARAARGGRQRVRAARAGGRDRAGRLGSAAMKLYVCWGTFRSPRPGGHPCRNAHEALKDAGWNPEVEKAYGLGILGDALNPTRRKVRQVSGQNMVPVLETDDEEVISGSDKIAKWARDNPATASDRA